MSIRIIVFTLIAALASPIHASGNISECGVFQYPDAVNEAINMKVNASRLQEEINNAANVSDADSLRIYERSIDNLEFTFQLNSARESLVNGDDVGFRDAIGHIANSTADSGFLPGFGTVILELFLYANDQGMTMDRGLMDAAIEQKKTYKTLDSSSAELLRLRAELSEALYLLSQGDSDPAEAMLNAISPDSDSVKDQFLRGHLSYKLADSTGDEETYRTAISELSRIEPERLKKCSATLFGMMKYFESDARLRLAKLLLRTEKPDIAVINRELHDARVAVKASRENFEMLYFPGLWTMAYEKSAEIYGYLAQQYPLNRERYQILQDRSRALANLN